MMEQWSVAAGDSPRGLVESAARAAMKVRERQVNEALRTLDEDHRLGRIARDEYRHRRRALLESLGDEIAQAGDLEVEFDELVGDAGWLHIPL